MFDPGIVLRLCLSFVQADLRSSTSVLPGLVGEVEVDLHGILKKLASENTPRA